MRGKRSYKTVKTEKGGITPADAGKTKRKKELNCPMQDHPRGCGENCTLCSGFNSWFGSPPRMRGKLS